MNRRNFLKNAASISSLGALQGLAVNLAAMADANATVDDPNQYKALVAVFLKGGNDNGNTLFPIDDVNYPLYQSYRAELALPKASGIPLNPINPLPSNVQYALHPSLSDLAKLFNAGDMAVLQNVGALTRPTTKKLYQTQYASMPAKLYSHNDQQKFWQMSTTDYRTGWGSALAQKMMTKNSSPLFTGVNVINPMPLFYSKNLHSLTLGENGPNSMIGFEGGLTKHFGITSWPQAVSQIMGSTNNSAMEQEISNIFSRSVYSQTQLRSVFKNSADVDSYFTGTDNLSKQLKVVAKMIKARDTLAMKRQVFVVYLDGFDLHSGLLTKHAGLLKAVNNAIYSFNNAMKGLGVNDNVTLFTMSEFGRTLNTNNGGSDHGWGSHHFIVGGAVNGKQIYGKTPSYIKDGEDDVGRGRLIPSTATSQYFATLAKWLGATDTDISGIIPYINNFAQKNLGFV